LKKVGTLISPEDFSGFTSVSSFVQHFQTLPTRALLVPQTALTPAKLVSF